MALTKINNVRIKGLAACVPSKVEENSDYPYFDENELDRIMPTIGVERRRVAGEGQTCSDFACAAAEKLLTELGWSKESVDLLIFCSPDRDYILPDTACVIHKKLGLPKKTMAFDMTLGCTGWTYGMITICSLLQNGGMKRALLLNGNMGSYECAYTDKTAYPLFSDTGTATALEFDEAAPAIYCEMGTDGEGYDSIIINDGGCRRPVTEESLKLVEYEKNIKRSKVHMEMKGMEVFSFALETAPKSLDEVLKFAGKSKDEIDLFVLHQANYYMLKKIIKKMRIPSEKAPISMKNFGNTGACSIPFTMVTERKEALSHSFSRNSACSFGVGLSWASLYFETENLVIPELIVYHG